MHEDKIGAVFGNDNRLELNVIHNEEHLSKLTIEIGITEIHIHYNNVNASGDLEFGILQSEIEELTHEENSRVCDFTIQLPVFTNAF